ncbi:MAG: CotH kinase family protein [Verrucomicrobiota bacterium]
MNAIQRCPWLASILLFSIGGSGLRAADNAAPVRISEVMAVPVSGPKDEDGELSGWIEIQNAGGMVVNLSGWYLTDTRTSLTKWRFPSVSLAPSKCVVVFASGKDRTRNSTYLHANFTLDQQGGYLALVNRATNVVSEFDPYPGQLPGTSFGRAPGDPLAVGSFPSPTPGKPNSSEGPGFGPVVLFSPAGGPLSESVKVQLSCPSVRTVIRYTLDGTMPTASSPAYREPIEINQTTHLRARAYPEGFLPGPPHTETYLFVNPNLQKFTSNLPVLVLDTVGPDRGGSSLDEPSHLTLFEPVKGRTSLTNKPALTTKAGYHERGSSTISMPKSSFVLHLLDEFNAEHDRSVLGLPADSDWVLYAPNFYEPVMIHNPFVHQLSREMGRYSPRTRFLELFVVKSSSPMARRQYMGVYVLEERIKIGKHRINIDRLGPADVNPPEVTGGYILKIDRLGPNESGFWAGDASVVYVEPKERVITLPERAPQKRYLAKFFTDFQRALHGPNWRDPTHGYPAYIEVDSWIDYHVLEVLSGNVDALYFSTYFYKPRNGKLAFGPHWDFDRALGSNDGRDDDPRRWNTGRFFSGPWWAQLFRDPDFWQRWVDRWQELRQAQFSLSHLNRLIDQLSDEVREAQPREVERWDLQPRGGSYQSEVNWMKEWLSNRIDFIDEQLTPRPALTMPAEPSRAGDLLQLIIPPGSTVFYTLDGSDPRAAQGELSANAKIYSQPIQLSTNIHLVTRARNPSKRQTGGPRISTPWSGPVSARIEVISK